MKKAFFMGAGLATLGAAIAGAYFLYGSKDGAKNRRRIKSWMFKAKGEILEKIENASELSQETYERIVDEVSGKYQALKNIHKNEIEEFVKEVKSHWKNISKELSNSGKKSGPKSEEIIEEPTQES
ncbi:hypothetical protein KW786_01650 [Candidatus Parcubacteria bacterium]|nr:hypothetical protein [Candidatus Parcubacteria bacterium]